MLIMCIDRDSRVLAYTVSPKRHNLMSIQGLTLTFLYISQAGLVHVYFNQSAGNFICLLKLNSNSLSYFAEHTTHFLQKLFFVRKECVLFTTMIFFFFNTYFPYRCSMRCRNSVHGIEPCMPPLHML